MKRWKFAFGYEDDRFQPGRENFDDYHHASYISDGHGYYAGRGIAQVATNGNLQVFKSPAFQYIGPGRIFGIAAQVVLMIVVVILQARPVKPT